MAFNVCGFVGLELYTCTTIFSVVTTTLTAPTCPYSEAIVSIGTVDEASQPLTGFHETGIINVILELAGTDTPIGVNTPAKIPPPNETALQVPSTNKLPVVPSNTTEFASRPKVQNPFSAVILPRVVILPSTNKLPVVPSNTTEFASRPKVQNPFSAVILPRVVILPSTNKLPVDPSNITDAAPRPKVQIPVSAVKLVVAVIAP